MTISLKQLSKALGEYDYSMRAASYGAQGNRSVIVNAIMNLPTPELEKLRVAIDAAIKDAVARTQAELTKLGIAFDEPHPLRVKASIDDPGSYFYKADRA